MGVGIPGDVYAGPKPSWCIMLIAMLVLLMAILGIGIMDPDYVLALIYTFNLRATNLIQITCTL